MEKHTQLLHSMREIATVALMMEPMSYQRQQPIGGSIESSSKALPNTIYAKKIRLCHILKILLVTGYAQYNVSKMLIVLHIHGTPPIIVVTREEIQTLP